MSAASHGPPHRISRALGSLAALVALFVAVPVALAAASRSRFDAANPLVGIDPPWRWEPAALGDAVAEPLRDDAVVNLLIRTSLTVIWLALAVVAVTIVVEVVHMVRHRGLAAPHVRGFGWAQGIGRWVAVGLIALVPINSFASTAQAVAGAATPAATAQRFGPTPEPASQVVGEVVSSFAPDEIADLPRPDAEAPESSTTAAGVEAPASSAVHVVARGESIYAIAADYAAGDGPRTIQIAEEILDLNLGAVMDDGQRFTNPALIQPGWMLDLPAGVGTPRSALPAVPDASDIDASDDTPTPVRGIPRVDADTDHVAYTVVPGDTLSGIAADHLDGQDDWPAIWEANRGDDMGGGRTFDDPHLILPGWEVDIPTADADSIDDLRAGDRPPPTDGGSDESAIPAEPTTPPAPTPRQPSPEDAPAPASTDRAPSTVAPAVDTPATTTPGVPASGGAGGDVADPGPSAPRAPAPIRIEHAALLAAGVLTLVGVRRRRALRAALPHARVPAPPPEVAAIERRLRTIDPGERAARIDVAVRAASFRLAETGVRIGSVRVAKDGAVTLRLTGGSLLDPPWVGDDATWTLPAAVPIEMLSDDARKVGQPCLALVTVGVDTDGRDVLVDLEAAGLTTIEAADGQADDVVRAIGSGLATSLDSEVVHLVVAGLGADCLFDHPNARELASVDAAMKAATALVGSTLAHDRSSFDLRTLRTGGEMWEPAITLFVSDDHALDQLAPDPGAFGQGLAVVSACPTGHPVAEAAGARLIAHADRWSLHAFGEEITLSPIGVTHGDLAEIAAILDDASQQIEADPPVPVDADLTVADPLLPRPHDIVVGLMGGVTITSADGVAGEFERSKTVELIAWLATHRRRATRAAARTALWEMDVRDATFANVVSEARRAMGRLVEPPEGEEWLARTLNESLPLHDRVVTDADLIEQRVEHARLAPPAHAIDVLRPAVEMIRDVPFAGTSYLWPDADGITSRLVLLATTAAAELAGHALSIGDTDLVFWATGQGLQVLPGHEELIGLRMRAHARSGDLAGVRHEWESYERVIMADSWSDGEPAPKLLDLRRELLTAG